MAFKQDNSSPNLVCFETEHYTSIQVGSAHRWARISAPGSGSNGASGSAAMQALPDDGTNYTPGQSGTPVLSYEVDFATSGNHNIWIRGSKRFSTTQSIANCDSYHIRIDSGSWITRNVMWVTPDIWAWDSYVINVPSSGLHTIHVQMREDGISLDKVVLYTDSTDPSLLDSGHGPSESDGYIAPYHAEVMEDSSSLVAYYTFDDDAGSTRALDSSGNFFHTETAVNPPTFNQPGPPGTPAGTSALFNISNETALYINDRANFNFGTAMSFCCLIKTPLDRVNHRMMVSQYNQNNTADAAYIFQVRAQDGKLQLNVTSDGFFDQTDDKKYIGTAVVDDNEWHLVGFTWNNGTLKIYVDGQEDVPSSVGSDPNFSTLKDASADILLGGYIGDDATPDHVFAGYMGESEFHNTALSQSRFQARWEKLFPQVSGDIPGTSSTLDGQLDVIADTSGSLPATTAALDGTLSTVANLAGTLSGSSTITSGELDVITDLSGTLAGQASNLAGSLDVGVDVSGTLGPTSSNIAGQLTSINALSGNLTGSAAALDGSLNVIAAISASLAGTGATLQSQIDLLVDLGGDIPGTVSTLAGVATAILNLAGDIPGTASTLAGQLSVVNASRTVSGNIQGTSSTLSGQLDVIAFISGTLPGTASALSSQADSLVDLSGDIPGTPSLLGGSIALVADRHITGQIQGTASTLAGAVNLVANLSGNIPATSASFSGSIITFDTATGKYLVLKAIDSGGYLTLKKAG